MIRESVRNVLREPIAEVLVGSSKERMGWRSQVMDTAGLREMDARIDLWLQAAATIVMLELG